MSTAGSHTSMGSQSSTNKSGSSASGQSDMSTRDSGASDELRRKASDVKQSVQELGSVAKAAANEKLGELRDTATQYYETGRERVYEAEQSLEEYIRDKPVKAVLIAAGVGFLFGACYMRR